MEDWGLSYQLGPSFLHLSPFNSSVVFPLLVPLEKTHYILPVFYQSGFYDDLRFCSFSCFLCLQGNCSVSLHLCMKTDEVLFGVVWTVGLGGIHEIWKRADWCLSEDWRLKILGKWLQNVINNSSQVFLWLMHCSSDERIKWGKALGRIRCRMILKIQRKNEWFMTSTQEQISSSN